LWSVLEATPTPEGAHGLTKGNLAKILRERRIRRLRASEVLRVLREKPIHAAPGVAEASAGQVVLLTARLRLTHTQRARCSGEVETALAEFEGDPDGDAAIVRPIPGVGVIVSAALLVDAGDLLTARDYKGLRSYAGIAPVTRQSGQQRLVVMRRACSTRLREALYSSMQRSAHCQTIYAAARARGQSHGRALRGLRSPSPDTHVHAPIQDALRPAAAGAIGLTGRESTPRARFARPLGFAFGEGAVPGGRMGVRRGGAFDLGA